MNKLKQKAETRKQTSSSRLAEAAQTYADLSEFIKGAEERRDRAAQMLRKHCPAGDFKVCGKYLVHVSRIIEHRVPAHVMPESLRLQVRKLGQ